jgi:2-C-methyl-D-erythritol 4-phosphate cytidylyltransferase
MINTFKLSELIRSVFGKKRPFTSVVLLCAGSGERMGEPKQFMEISGLPVFVRAAMNAAESPYVDEIVIVGRNTDLSRIRELCDSHNLTKITQICAGGETRQESALAGFESISPKSKYVVFHDAARCLCCARFFDLTITKAYEKGAAIAAKRVTDTIKEASGTTIKATVPRENLWAAATPQVFKVNLYSAAAYTAKKDGFTVTDDSSLCERLGVPVELVDCGDENIKLTTPGDVAIAEAMLIL